MAITAQDVIDRVRVIVGDINAVNYLDTDIIRWINDAIVDDTRDASHPQTQFVTFTSSGSETYGTGGNHFYAVDNVTYAGRVLQQVSKQEMDIMFPDRQASPSTNLGVPQWYYVDPDIQRVVLYPTPDTIAQLAITAAYKGTVVTAPTDVLPVPDEWLETIVTHCLQKAKEWEDNYTGASYFAAQKQRMQAENMHSQAVAETQYPSVISLGSDDW